MKKTGLCLLVFLAVAALNGCTGMADAMSQMGGMGVVTEKVSTFDGAKVVEVTPQFLYNPKRLGGNSYRLGARWNSLSPEYVALIMEYSSSTSMNSAYVSLTELNVNISGSIYSYKATDLTDHSSSGWNSISKTIYTTSMNSVVVPFELLEEMLTAEDVRLRVHSGDGYEDSVFSQERIPGGQATALLSLREFMSRVQAIREGAAISG
ncbi:hypothetical protein MO867_20510 [Microbulbifer sp. OS29]|uniref:Uncharacterized protein n=1 Tax=Microbulbifer okhotskensis TaxID=2926617 RepID=A0A9X2EVI6_9GAMM|nr:hypothetical protein [Microbulbifer okhotskensis]MCO1336713.1 hypothetical protein [Microbulbifer okhotskensis]